MIRNAEISYPSSATAAADYFSAKLVQERNDTRQTRFDAAQELMKMDLRTMVNEQAAERIHPLEEQAALVLSACGSDSGSEEKKALFPCRFQGSDGSKKDSGHPDGVAGIFLLPETMRLQIREGQ